DVWREVLSHYTLSDPRTPELDSQVFSCVSDAFHCVIGNQNVSTDDNTSLRDVISRVDHVQIFVTGSLYLVGMVLKLLEADSVNI
ncbi:---NA---, partial [Paramuricea clavata]